MNIGRVVRLKASTNAGRGQTHQGLLEVGDAETAEQAVSDAIVQSYLVRGS